MAEKERRDFAISVRALDAIGRVRPEYCQIGHAADANDSG